MNVNAAHQFRPLKSFLLGLPLNNERFWRDLFSITSNSNQYVHVIISYIVGMVVSWVPNLSTHVPRIITISGNFVAPVANK